MSQSLHKIFNLKKVAQGILFLFVILMSFGQLQKLEFFGGVTLFFHDLLFLVTVSLSFLLLPSFRKKVIFFFSKRTALEYFFLFWVGVGFGIASLSSSSILFPTLYITRLFLYLLFILWVQWSVSMKAVTTSFLAFIGVFWISMFSLFGLLQYFLIPDTQFLFFLGWDDHYYRLVSTLLDPGFTGILYVLGWIFLEGVWQAFPQLQKYLWIKTVVTAGIMVCLLLTYSRASYMAFLGAAGWLFVSPLFTRRRSFANAKYITVLVFFFVLAIPFLPRPHGEGVRLERTTSANARLQAVERDFTEIHGLEWLTGQGLFVSQESNANQENEYQVSSHARVSDNWIMMLLKGTGVVGTLIAGVWLARSLWYWSKRNVWTTAAIFGLLIHGLFNASVVYPFTILFMGILIIFATETARATRSK